VTGVGVGNLRRR